MSRAQAIHAAERYFDDGRFFDDLARRVAIPTESQNPERAGSLARYLEVLEERERGINLPPGHVPSTFLFAFKGERIIGRVSIRHRLNDLLLRVGGHIGYVIVPEFRRQGYATASLRLAMDAEVLAVEVTGQDL